MYERKIDVNTIHNPFEFRTLSSFGISIGTGLSLESVFLPTTERYDSKREIPEKISPTTHKLHIYNIYTVGRNILSAATEKDKFKLLLNKHFLDTVISELETISMLYCDIDTNMLVYVPNYTTLLKKYNRGKNDKITSGYTDYQMMFKLFKNINSKLSMNVIMDSYKLPANLSKVLILSSYVFDLLNVKVIPKLDMLESYTGKIKSKSFWNSKYHPIGKRDMKIFPFLEELLYLLGDKTIAKTTPVSVRVELYELAVSSGWTVNTSKMKILSDIKKSERLIKVLKEYK